MQPLPLATIPSPSQGVWHLGPLPLRAYALMIILGIVVAVWLGERRWTARGGTPGAVIDVAVWAVPFGLVGGRLYHVLTDWERYFGEDGDPGRALQIWEGGLGIWGAVVLGALGAYLGCRRRGISVLALGDAVAPGIALAQAIGRWGNWWNQELYGRPLDTWWALEIDPAHRPKIPGTDVTDPRYADVATYHPTFLYESLWCVALALVVIWAGRRFSLTHGRTFALYVAGYTVGRFWIEWLRIDEAHVIAGLRLNDWTSLVVFAGAVAYLYLARTRTGPEPVKVRGAEDDPTAPALPTSEQPEPTTTEQKPKSTATSVTADTPAEPLADDEPEPGTDTEPTADKPKAAPAPVAADEPEPPAEPVAEEPEPVAGTEPDTDAAPEPVAEKPEAGADADPVAEKPEAETPAEPVAEGPETAPQAVAAEEPEVAPEPVAQEPEAGADAEPVVEEPEAAAVAEEPEAEPVGQEPEAAKSEAEAASEPVAEEPEAERTPRR
ncbi:MAG TPA: prolipoprotein diacylglyceryl transferase [Thermomonospora sp.]|nr:prolipoprotein diacylglyceryl transferase [Thermomonospora sp.]